MTAPWEKERYQFSFLGEITGYDTPTTKKIVSGETFFVVKNFYHLCHTDGE